MSGGNVLKIKLLGNPWLDDPHLYRIKNVLNPRAVFVEIRRMRAQTRSRQEK